MCRWLLYDVTTLYFEAEKEDGLRKVGYSKERRVDPQIVVGLLVDRAGFPLEIGMFEGNKAETHTLIPIITQFKARHSIADMVVVADAGMLSVSNLHYLYDAGLQFIGGSRQVKAPGDLEKHFYWNGTSFTDGQVVDTITPRGKHRPTNPKTERAGPVWDCQSHPSSWRAIWAYSQRRFVRDNKTPTLQRNRALAFIDGEKRPKKPRFTKETDGTLTFDEAAFQRAVDLAGLKGYVTNIPASVMGAAEVISSYHDLWHVEQSFRMSKTDLQARPIFHRQKDTIDAHLTNVFAALAISRYIYAKTGVTTVEIIKTPTPLRHVTVRMNGHTIEATPEVPEHAQNIIDALTH